MQEETVYHALRSYDGCFLAEIHHEQATGVAEIVTADFTSFAIARRLAELCNEVAASLGLDDDDVYLTDENETQILF